MIVQKMAISNLVLTRQSYSEETNGAHAHYREPVPLTLSIPSLWKNTLMKRRRGLAVESVPVRTGKNNLLQHTSKTMLLKRCS